MTFSHVGADASSKSASQTLAPEFRALMVILRSVGPVISTRRSFSAAGAGATFQESSARIAAVSGRKSSVEVRAISARRSPRRASSSSRRGVNRRCSSATKARAASVRTSSCRGRGSASTMASGDGAGADMSCHSFSGRCGRRLCGRRAARNGTACQGAGMRPWAPSGIQSASDLWIVVSSWWKFNGLLMSRFSGSTEVARDWRSVPVRAQPVHSRCVRSSAVSMSYASATSEHSTSVIASRCARRYVRAPWSPTAPAATSAHRSAPNSTG